MVYHKSSIKHLVYGCQIWGQTNNYFNDKNFKLQNRALRIITFSNFRADSCPLYNHLKILKLKDQIILQNCLFVYDALKKVSPICFQEYFRHASDVHIMNTRSSSLGCLFVTFNRTITYGLKSITNQCISHWNVMSKKFNINLLSLSRLKLKLNIKLHFVQLYS